MTQTEETFEGKLIPILRQGIDIIKMVLFKELKPHLEKSYPRMTSKDITRLSGAVVNTIFGIQNPETRFVEFANQHHRRIKREVDAFADNFNHLQIPLTDALRVQYLCDRHEGIDSQAVLEKARRLKLLIDDRDIPLPGAFLSLVRTFGVAYKVLEPIDKGIRNSHGKTPA